MAPSKGRVLMMKTTGDSWPTSQCLSLALGLVACFLLMVSSGCNKGPAKPDDMPELTACTVTVTYKGQPVADASVLFAPVSGEFSAAGTTDSAGKAVMKTDALYEGVAAGEYRVTVTKREQVASDLGETPEDPAELEAYQKKLKATPAPKHLLPEKYSSFATSGLTVTIAQGTPANETFELTD